MRSDDAADELNSAQRLHLVNSAEYADKLLADVESVLVASKSKSPFRKYKNSLSPAQVKVVGDYIAGIRAQMVRVLDAQGIPFAGAQIRVDPCNPRDAGVRRSCVRGVHGEPDARLWRCTGIQNPRAERPRR